jgi:hypothetical protein
VALLGQGPQVTHHTAGMGLQYKLGLPQFPDSDTCNEEGTMHVMICN